MNAGAELKPPTGTPPVKLTADIVSLVEQLAEFNHECWLKERTGQGWKFGPKRDEDRKENPCMVPYAELSEDDKKFNRATALETIRTILDLGYNMMGPQGRSLVTDEGTKQRLQETINQIRRNPKLTVADLRRIWEQHAPAVWAQNVEVYRRSVDVALRLGEAFLAFDISAEGLVSFKNDLRLTQLQALALARTGATRRANSILDHLRQSGHQDEETLGILARTHKDFYTMASDPAEKQKHLRTSFDLYYTSYQRNRGYYSGINAATMGLMAGEKEIARKVAQEVTELCERTLENLSPESDERYWLEATLAEADIILGDFEKAADHYRRSTVGGSDKMAVISRTRAQARLLLEHIVGNPNLLDYCFRLPRIVVFSGHMFDRPDRKRPRFPMACEGQVREVLARRLQEIDAQVGYSSLACGSDLLFNECMMERGGEIHIALPFNKTDFRQCSVDIIPGVDFGARFENLLARAGTVTVLSESGNASDSAGFDYCNRALDGMALLKGKFYGMDVVPLAVWNGQGGDGAGGTSSFVDFWRARTRQVEIIRIDELVEGGGTDLAAGSETSYQEKPPGFKQEIKAMLFADIVGFTRLKEMQVPAFVEHFLGRVADLMERMPHPPIHRNTWGDAVCCVFNEVRDAGVFALKLRDLVRGADWGQFGLPNELNIRIALHAGPVYACYDPVLKKMTYNGSHVNRTARIEPVAEEGQIYASQAFAALATAEGVAEFTCDYVGTKQLAKKYGAIPVFLVRPTG
jgi:class 3 adenylate cyclase